MTEMQKFIMRLYNDNRDSLLRAARVCVKNEEDAEDLVHEVFVRAINSYGKLVEHKNPEAWLSTTLKNCIRNYRRLHANRRNISLEEYGDLAAPELAERLSHIIPEQLPTGDKAMLIWRIEQRLSYREIGKRLGISEEAARVKMSRIVGKCKELMPKSDFYR